MKRDKLFAVRVLSEDSSKGAIPTMKALSARLLRQVDPSARIEGVDISALPDDAARKEAVGTHWKSKDRTQVLLLVGVVATHLAKGDFVLFHVDGDRRWSARQTSDNATLFETRFKVQVRARLRDSGRSEAEADAALSRLRVVMPFYSIEAWLFQNTDAAASLCRSVGHPCRARLHEWKANRSALDEVEQPKEQIRCIDGSQYAGLAGAGFPSNELLLLGSSFTATVMHLGACGALVSALRRTHSYYSR